MSDLVDNASGNTVFQSINAGPKNHIDVRHAATVNKHIEV